VTVLSIGISTSRKAAPSTFGRTSSGTTDKLATISFEMGQQFNDLTQTILAPESGWCIFLGLSALRNT